MSALALLSDLQARGVSVSADATDLVVNGTEEVLTDELVARLRTMKAEIVAALAEQAEADLLDAYEERAAILEYDEGLDRPAAEALARKQVFGEAADVPRTAVSHHAVGVGGRFAQEKVR